MMKRRLNKAQAYPKDMALLRITLFRSTSRVKGVRTYSVFEFTF